MLGKSDFQKFVISDDKYTLNFNEIFDELNIWFSKFSTSCCKLRFIKDEDKQRITVKADDGFEIFFQNPELEIIKYGLSSFISAILDRYTLYKRQ
jgi:hypothetical protein